MINKLNSVITIVSYGEDCIFYFTGKTIEDYKYYYNYMVEYYKCEYENKLKTKKELDYILKDLKKEYDNNMIKYNKYKKALA